MAAITGDGAQLIDLGAARMRRVGGIDSAHSHLTNARRTLGMDHGPFADLLSKHLGWAIYPEQLRAWEQDSVPPGDVLITALELVGAVGRTLPPGVTAADRLTFLVDYDDLQLALAEVVEGAHEVLAITGSRSRDPAYLRLIERTLTGRPDLVHYRVLYGPPRHGALKNHLLHLADLARGGLHIGVVRDLLRDQERFLCVNERMALIVQPSATSIANYDTALVIDDPDIARRYVNHVQQAYLGAEPVPDRSAVLALEVVR
ncbi:MAG TPA: hypothetical protein VFM55_19000 [Micromonosporaceae bacterium]|nr:hypothetical protein [Micromonosporaceae bacterium]